MRPRILVLILLTSLFFLLAAAPWQTEPPPTPAPTATLTFIEHLTVHGFDAQAREWALREWGWELLLVALLVLSGIGWWARPYLKRIGERRDESAKKRLDDTLGDDPFAEATAAYLERFEKKYSQFSFRGLEDVSGAKVPEFDAAYISLRLSTATSRQRPLGNKTGPEETMMREAPVGYAGFFHALRG